MDQPEGEVAPSWAEVGLLEVGLALVLARVLGLVAGLPEDVVPV